MNPSGASCSIPRPGIWATLASALGYSFCSVCAKKISEEYSPFQALYVRGLITTILAIGILMYDTSLPIPPQSSSRVRGVGFWPRHLGCDSPWNVLLRPHHPAPVGGGCHFFSGANHIDCGFTHCAWGADHWLSHLFPSLARDWGRVCLRSRCFVYRIQE